MTRGISSHELSSLRTVASLLYNCSKPDAGAHLAPCRVLSTDSLDEELQTESRREFPCQETTLEPCQQDREGHLDLHVLGRPCEVKVPGSVPTGLPYSRLM